MNSPFSDQYGLQYYATASDLEYSPLMQTISTSTSTTTLTTISTSTPSTSTSKFTNQSEIRTMSQQPIQPLFRPYNHYPTYGITPTVSTLGPYIDRPYKSAFHPVIRGPSNTSTVLSTTARIYASESSYYNPLSVTATSSENYYSPATSENPYSIECYFGRSKPPKLLSIDNSETSENPNKFPTSELRRNIQNNDTCPYKLPPKQKPFVAEKISDQNLHKPVIESAKLNNEHPTKSVYNWDTLLPTLLPSGKNPEVSLVYDPKKRSEAVMSPTKICKRRRQNAAATQSNEADVTVIDLTVNEEDEDAIVTKPIEINCNEILITTNTKTMQAITFRKPKDIKINAPTKSPELNLNQCNSSLNDKRTNFPALFANLTQPSYRNRKYVPPKEQSKFITKYNGWMRQYRTYNGFRCYVRQNYTRAEAYAILKQNPDRTFVQDTLMNWWNELPDTEKDFFIKNANFMLTKRSEIMQNNTNIKTVDSLNVPASFSIPIESAKCKSVVTTPNMTENNHKLSENTNKGQAGVSLHSPKP